MSRWHHATTARQRKAAIRREATLALFRNGLNAKRVASAIGVGYRTVCRYRREAQ